MLNLKGNLQFDEKRGVVYFYDEKGRCRLRIQGLHGTVSEDGEVDIHLVEPGGEHHHEHCAGGGRVGIPADPNTICAVKLIRPEPVKR